MRGEPSIRLHREKGLNPHMTVCPRCGKDGDSIVLLGATDKIHTCPKCGLRHVGRPDDGECQGCGAGFARERWKTRTIEDYERLPVRCKACDDELAEWESVVKAGGVYFRCADCKTEGVIRAESEMAKAAREQLGVPPPKPCGVQFTKADCPLCTGQVTRDASTP